MSWADTVLNIARKVWKFIWNDNSIWSWIVNAILAFLIIKFLLYPGLGLVLHTSHPVVAVVSDSMKYKSDFDEWWQSHSQFYEKLNITKEEFREFPLSNGFNKGDLIIVRGKKAEDIKIGDIIVFRSNLPEPVIHRVVKTTKSELYYFSTKGDANKDQIPQDNMISQQQVIGTGFVRVPLIGNVKIAFTSLVRTIRGG